MAVVPKKLSFQLRFRNKTKTRKILSRDFRLQGLLKKDSNNSNRFNYPLVKKEEQKRLLKNPLMAPSLKIKNQKAEETRVVEKARVDFKKDLKDNLLYLGLSEAYRLEARSSIKEKTKCLLFTPVVTKTGVKSESLRREKSHSNLIKPNKYLYIHKKNSFFRPSWFLTNRVKINNNYYINPKKVADSNLQLIESQVGIKTFKSQKFLNTGWLSNKNKFLNNVFKSDYIFLKKKEATVSRVNRLLFGRYGVCFKQYSIISSKCAETAKLDIAKILRKKGRFWIRICCDTPISARPAETRMGKGKGSISYWAAKVNPGQLFFEFSGVSLVQLKEIYQTLCKKSAVSLKTVY